MTKTEIQQAYDSLLTKYNLALEKLQEAYEMLDEQPVEKNTDDLKEAARLMASSELNKEDLSIDEIYNLLQKTSEQEARKKIGFWAMPLPKDTDKPETTKRYIGKK